MLNVRNFILFSLLAVPGLVLATPSESQFIGAVMGAAIGDALGRVTEFCDTTSYIQQIYGSQGLSSFNQFKKTDWIDNKALYTDDTVMAKILLEDALNAKGQNLSSQSLMSNYAQHCIALFGKDKYLVDPYYNYRAHGPTNINSCRMLEALLQNKFPATISQILATLQPDSSTFDSQVNKEGGCGSVMRAWPLGLIYYDDIALVIQLAEKQSLITHRHPMARAACVAMAVGTACALQGMSVEQIVAQMASAAAAFDTQEILYKPDAVKLGDSITFDPSLVSKNKLLTSDMITYAYQMALQGKSPEVILGTHNLKQGNYRSPNGFLLGWAADEAVAAAVYVFARHPQDLKSALREGVNTPGDCDSIATLAGALVGAHSGIESLQESGFDYSKLENKDELIGLAKQAYEVAHQV